MVKEIKKIAAKTKKVSPSQNEYQNEIISGFKVNKSAKQMRMTNVESTF